MKSFKEESLSEEERRGTETEKKRERRFESSLGPLGFRTLNKKFQKKKKIFKNFCGERRTSKNEALKSTHEALKP